MTAPGQPAAVRGPQPAGSDRARRKTIVCSSCGQESAHRGHGWCVACYGRWVYWGRPPQGPPPPWFTPARPPQPKPAVIPARCRSGRHLLAEDNLITGGGTWECRACRRETHARYRRRRFTRRHHGHDVITTTDGRPYCRTCVRGDHDIDHIAVERAVSGNPPQRLTTAERELAILQLRAWALTYELISQRVGCSLRTAYATCKRLGATQPAGARLLITATRTTANRGAAA